MIARVLQVVSAFATLRIMTAQLTPEEVGKTAIILSVAMFFTLILVSPVGNYINRHLNEWHSCGLMSKRFQIAGIYLICVTFFSVIIIALGYEWFGKDWGLTLFWLSVLVAGVVLLKTMNMSMVTSLNLLGERIPWAVLTILTLWVGLGASWVLTQYEHTAEYWMLGQLLGFFSAGILATVLVLRQNNETPIKTGGDESFRVLMLPVLAFCIPLALSTGLNWVQFQSYRLVLGEMMSLAFLGLFAAGYAVSAGILGAFESTVQQYFYPKFYKGLEEGGDAGIADTWLQYASLVLPFTLLTGVMVAMLATPLTHILVDPSFWEASSFVALGAMVEVCRVAGNVYGLAAHGTMKTKILVFPQMLGAFAVLVFVPIALEFSPGNAGVATALIVASLLYVLSMHFVIGRHLSVTFSLESFYPLIYIIPLFLIISFLSEFHTGGLVYDGLLLVVAGVFYLGIAYRTYNKLKATNPSIAEA